MYILLFLLFREVMLYKVILSTELASTEQLALIIDQYFMCASIINQLI